MSDVTHILSKIESGDPSAAELLLPLVYDELRKLAAARLAHENPGHTLQATALVHEAYIRLVDVDRRRHWDGRAHFFAAAANAMRRILVEDARRKNRLKRGGGFARREIDDIQLAVPEIHEDVAALDEALDRLQAVDPLAVKLVQLRYFAGMPMAEIATILGVSPRTADRLWAFARAWLHQEIAGAGQNSERA